MTTTLFDWWYIAPAINIAVFFIWYFFSISQGERKIEETCRARSDTITGSIEVTLIKIEFWEKWSQKPKLS